MSLDFDLSSFPNVRCVDSAPCVLRRDLTTLLFSFVSWLPPWYAQAQRQWFCPFLQWSPPNKESNKPLLFTSWLFWVLCDRDGETNRWISEWKGREICTWVSGCVDIWIVVGRGRDRWASEWMGESWVHWIQQAYSSTYMFRCEGKGGSLAIWWRIFVMKCLSFSVSWGFGISFPVGCLL